MAGGGLEKGSGAAGLLRFADLQVLAKHPQGANMELPRCDEARSLLLQAAKQVEPVMKRRGWTVGKLIEIIPPNQSLLGWNENQGATIAIRLRRVHNDDSFFDFPHILGTLLHELCHIEIGPHNDKFYALLDEIWAEAEALMDKGVSGLGNFEGTGYRSGGLLKSQSEMQDARLQAALKRQKISELMGGPSSGKRLGGSSASKDIKALAAEAAQRRAADDLWCRPWRLGLELREEAWKKPGVEGKASSLSSNGASALPEASVSSLNLITNKAAEGKEINGGENGLQFRLGAKNKECRLVQHAFVDLTNDEEIERQTEENDLVAPMSSHANTSVSETEGRRGGGGGRRAKNVGTPTSSDDVIEIFEDSGQNKVDRGIRGGFGEDVFTMVCLRCSHVNSMPFPVQHFEEAPLCDSCGALL